ncbi:MAG: ferrous iron transport protein A [Desmonostoc vinosum HA7617-LM4]|jgi:ferrous iron transport protein A|nr:ferrous iron transport protein A [Desmonostoc vinosum HA7617-LM4]
MFIPFSVTGCSLELLRTGERGIISFCQHQDATIIKKLISMRLTPGTIITLEQRFPDLIIKIADTLSIITQDTARNIYIRIIDS